MSGQLVYIARAIDGSWVSPVPAASQEEARAQIAAHEPDVTQHSAYQILVETMHRLMTHQVKGVKARILHRLVKWDGDAPIPVDAADQPHKYPQVAEVIEGGDGMPTKVIYRRS